MLASKHATQMRAFYIDASERMDCVNTGLFLYSWALARFFTLYNAKINYGQKGANNVSDR